MTGELVLSLLQRVPSSSGAGLGWEHWVGLLGAAPNSALPRVPAGGGDVKIENQKLNFKEKAQAKVGSLDNVGHTPTAALKVSQDLALLQFLSFCCSL